MKIFEEKKVQTGGWVGHSIYDKTIRPIRLDISHVNFRAKEGPWCNKQGFLVYVSIGENSEFFRFEFVVVDITKEKLLERTDARLFQLFLDRISFTPELLSNLLLLGAKEGRNEMRYQIKQFLKDEG